MKRALLVFGLALAIFETDTAASAQTAVDIDGAFVVAATQGNDAEIDMAHLVLERGRMDEALSFARLMLDDHTALAKALALVVPAATASVPERENAADRLALARLAQLPRSDMDQEYLI